MTFRNRHGNRPRPNSWIKWKVWPPDRGGYGIRLFIVCFVMPPLIWSMVLTPIGLATQVLMWDFVEYKLAQFKYDMENNSNGPTAS